MALQEVLLDPIPHASDQASVVLFLDANMPSVREHRDRCEKNVHHMCLCRLGPAIWLCRRPLWVPRPGNPPEALPAKYNRLRDIEVAQWWIHTIRCRWRDTEGAIQRKRYVLLTHDEDFVADAKREYEKDERGDRSYIPEFGDQVISSGQGNQRVSLEIYLLPQVDRDHDFQVALEYAHRIVPGSGPIA